MFHSNDYRMAAERLIDYLAREYDDAGVSRTAPGNVQFYYKLPAVLHYGGKRVLAQHILNEAVRRFAPGGKFTLDSDPFAGPWLAYLAGWFAWGAGALGRFEVARMFTQSVLSFQDVKLGGFRHQSPRGPLFDTERSSAALMGCTWAMALEAGESVARFLRTVIEEQPAPEAEFHAYLNAEGKVAEDRGDRNAYYSFSDRDARPALFSTTVSGLVWLGRSTGKMEYIQLANEYLQIARRNPSCATLPLATKLGWSALMVAQHVDDPKLVSFAQSAGEGLIGRQQEDGSISFDAVPDLPKPLDRVWLIGWNCDAALTLMALADGGA